MSALPEMRPSRRYFVKISDVGCAAGAHPAIGRPAGLALPAASGGDFLQPDEAGEDHHSHADIEQRGGLEAGDVEETRDPCQPGDGADGYPGEG